MAVSDAGLRELLFPESLRIKKRKIQGRSDYEKMGEKASFHVFRNLFLGNCNGRMWTETSGSDAGTLHH